MEFITGIFYIIPKNLISFLVGWVVRLRWPGFMAQYLNQTFVRAFNIDMNEAEKSLASYQTLEEVFTRALKPESRQIAAPLCSPADGMLSCSGPTKNNEAVQAKGLTYRVDELVFGKAVDPEKINLAWFYTVYLAPHNYHRVHSPVSGRLERLRYFPGQLWPVNTTFVGRIPNLFVRNERLVFDIAVEGGGYAYVVMVGALNVGRIATRLAPDFVTNSLRRQLSPQPAEIAVPATALAAGDELGIFMLGSTAIVVLDATVAARLKVERIGKECPVRMGASLMADQINVD